MPLDLREIEAFLAVADEGHFRRAADRLGVTPSRISQIIRSLERRIGAVLFLRTSRTVRLTPVGTRLLEAWRPARLALQQGFAEARATADGGRQPLRVGFASTVPDHLAQKVISGFMADRGVACLRHARPSVDIVTWLTRDRAGVFVTWFPCAPDTLELPRIRWGPPIAAFPRAVLMARSHPLARRTSVEVDELTDHTVLASAYPEGLDRRYLDAWAPKATPSGRVIPHAPRRIGHSLEELIEPLRSGDLVHLTVTAVAETYHLPDFAVVPLEGLPPFQLRPLWSAANEDSAIRDFAEYAAQAGARSGWL
jgi:DNA-binding transcriptional LysR family regulator